jgi:hypothetical protein
MAMVDRDDADVSPIDLSALDAHRDPLLADRVIGATMARIRASTPALSHPRTPESVLVDVAQWWYPAVAAAALIAVVAGLTVIRHPHTAADQGADSAVSDAVETRLLEWAQSGHVPTNGDVLAAFGETTR